MPHDPSGNSVPEERLASSQQSLPQLAQTRRAFLGSAAVLAAAPVAISPAISPASLFAQDPANDSGDSTGVTIYKTLKWGMIQIEGSVEEKFAALAEMGYDGSEIDSPDGIDPLEARAAAKKAGLIVDGVVDSKHWKVRMSDPDPVVREASRQDLITALKASHAAGGTTALLVPGHGKDGSKAEVKSRAAEQIQMALPTAARLGVFILIENVWNQMFYDHEGPSDQTADELAEFVDSFNSPWVGVQFDIGNHQKYGPPADWIRTLGKRIVKLDAKDWGVENGFCKLGDGDVDWVDVRKALGEIGFQGWAAAEVAGGDRARLQDISDRMDRVFGLAS